MNLSAEIMAVGTELLLGQIANTNAQVVSEALATIGVDVLFHTTVGDNELRIAEAIGDALARVDVLIITGGLGPTHDDLTREAIARATGRPLEKRNDLEADLVARFERMGRAMAATNLRQADQPRGARAIPNPRGTAPGVALEHEGKRIFAIPGVPSEMHGMLLDHILPELGERTRASLSSRVLNVSGLPESEVALLIGEEIQRLDRDRAATIALLATAGGIKVRITAKAVDEHAAAAIIAPVEERLRALLGSSIYGVDDETLESVIAALMMEQGLTLAVAESVTGGAVSARLVDVPGASRFLRAAYVAYSNDAKIKDLDVPVSVITQHGSVSAESAAAMSEGARARAGADLGLATTGEAGPEPQEAEVGTVFLGLAWDQGTATRGFKAAGGRDWIRRWAANGALNLLRLWLIGELR